MSNDFRSQVYRNINQKTTNELIAMWQTNNRTEWSDMTFDVIQEILQKRGVDIPKQDKPVTKQSDTSESRVRKVTSMNIAQILFTFDGRIGLGTYWLGVLGIVAFTTIIALIDVANFDYTPYSGIPTILGRLLVIWPGLALTVKRWHDRDKSGWWVFIGLLPIVGQIWAFVENGLLAGTKGPNQYGLKSF